MSRGFIIDSILSNPRDMGRRTARTEPDIQCCARVSIKLYHLFFTIFAKAQRPLAYFQPKIRHCHSFFFIKIPATISTPARMDAIFESPNLSISCDPMIMPTPIPTNSL